MSIAGVGPGHEHELPAPLLKRLRLLTWATVVLGVCLAAIGTLLLLIVLQRSEQRDRENAELNQRLDDAVRGGQCGLLDQLPAGGYADRLRDAFDCGPGIPLSDLPPEDAARIQEQRGVTRPPVGPDPLAEVDSPRSPMDGASGPTSEPSQPSPSPTTPAPSPTVPPPLVDLGPITDMACESVRVCF